MEETENKVTHAVFKHEDIKGIPEVYQRELATIAYAYRKEREKAGKAPMPEYIVINCDENPQMIERIVEVMKAFGKWGE